MKEKRNHHTTAEVTPLLSRSKGEAAKYAKFRELAEKRTNRALEHIRLIGNLTNRNNYVYGEKERLKIIGALKAAIRKLDSQFQRTTNREKDDFTLTGN